MLKLGYYELRSVVPDARRRPSEPPPQERRYSEREEQALKQIDLWIYLRGGTVHETRTAV